MKFYTALITLSSVIVGMMGSFFLDRLGKSSQMNWIFFWNNHYFIGLLLLLLVAIFGIYIPLYMIRGNSPRSKFLFYVFVSIGAAVFLYIIGAMIL